MNFMSPRSDHAGFTSSYIHVILLKIQRAGVTLNQSLLESVLHSLLIDDRDHMVEMYQGSGAKWTKSRQVLLHRFGICLGIGVTIVVKECWLLFQIK